MVYTYGVRVRGELQSSYSFTSKEEVERWRREDFPRLEEQYGKLIVKEFALPGLKVGDTCRVWGDGNDEYTILQLVTFSKDRPGFVLDSGEAKEVASCHKEGM